MTYPVLPHNLLEVFRLLALGEVLGVFSTAIRSIAGSS